MSNWKDAEMVCEDGIIETWACYCHNGLKFSGNCKESAELERSVYYCL